ncbi:MAG TPA: tetratricopeptide repeat protein [Anaeromyxobacteraceae bacterium]|nr:tetratricopeptide repeat protein [Anaeromyxobacteraceae bacterium]
MAKNTAELTRKEMKAPDAFQAAAGRAAGWVAGHEKQIVAAVVGVVAILGVALGVQAWLESSRKAAGVALFGVLSAADGQVSSVPLPGANAPVFPTAEAQQKDIAAKAAEVRREYPSSESARTAALAAGEAQLRLGAYDEALAAFESYLSSAKAGDSLAFLAEDGLARAREAKGDLAGALAAIERLPSLNPAFADRAALERARVLARQGKVEDSRKILQAFPTEFKDSQAKAEAEAQLARLAATK